MKLCETNTRCYKKFAWRGCCRKRQWWGWIRGEHWQIDMKPNLRKEVMIKWSNKPSAHSILFIDPSRCSQSSTPLLINPPIVVDTYNPSISLLIRIHNHLTVEFLSSYLKSPSSSHVDSNILLLDPCSSMTNNFFTKNNPNNIINYNNISNLSNPSLAFLSPRLFFSPSFIQI